MDQSRDVGGREFYRLTRLYPAPEFVKQADTAALCGNPELPPEAFGDPRRRLFPCHTAAATWSSLAFFTNKRASFKGEEANLIAERLDRMAKIHGITAATEAIKAAAAQKATPEGDLPDDDFALVWTAGGQSERHYPLRNSGEVKAAGEYLKTHRDAFPFAVRRGFADRVLDKAAALGVKLSNDLDDFLTKQAGYGACPAEEAVGLIYDRVQVSRRGPGRLSEIQTEMLKLAETIGKNPAQFRASNIRCKTAEVIDQFDREQGLRDYGPDFPRVEDVLFALTREKAASVVAEHCETVTGSVYQLVDLERVKLAAVRDYFGDSFADQLTADGIRVNGEKAGRFIGTLPRRDAQDFEKFLTNYGLKPVAKTASDRIGFSEAHLRAMAELRKTAMAVR